MKVTISDVARLAGVSTATVSHTINQTRYVSEETRDKVYAAIRELGYTPDASARSFRTGKKKTVGFVVPDIFTSVAFDSGGVASGPMTATFLLPFALGACEAVGGNLVTDAFGVVAMVAMTPLVTIQLLGLSYQRKLKHAKAPAAAPVAVEPIIELC